MERVPGFFRQPLCASTRVILAWAISKQVINEMSAYALLQCFCCLTLCYVQSSGHSISKYSEVDYPGPVPPSGHAESCVAAYRRLAGMACEQIESMDPRILLQHCHPEDGHAHGTIAFYFNSSSEGQQVFRVRMTGPEILLPDILYVGTKRRMRSTLPSRRDLTTLSFCTCTKISRTGNSTLR